MNTRLHSKLAGLASLVLATSVAAHQDVYPDAYRGGVSGSVSVWSVAPYGRRVSGTVNFGQVYVPAPAYYSRAVWYPACGHWHLPDYYRGYAYPHDYAYGHSRGNKHGRGRGYRHHR